jgi:Ca-activated chloride channel family protein
MTFERPYLLLSLLLVAAALGVWVLAERRRMRYAVRFTNLDVLASVVRGRSWSRYVAPALFTFALAALLVSLARPHVNRTVTSERATVILVLDTSRSMQARDVVPTRLGAAQEAVRTFLDQVPRRLRVSLIAFAGEAQVATPPTRDHELVRQAVDGIGDFLIYGGTAIGDALQVAVELGRRALEQKTESEGGVAVPALSPDGRMLAADVQTEPQRLVSILFLSDGAQTRGILQPLQGAQLAKDAGIPVYTVALGTPNGTVTRGGGFFGGPNPRNDPGSRIRVPPDPTTLRAIAEMTGGAFTEARTAEALESAYAELGSSLGREPGESEITFILVAIAAGFLLASGIAGTFFSSRLP